jgi:hypothetical protein
VRSFGPLVIFAVFAGTVHAAESTATCDEARRSGAYRQAAECYRLAGEPVEADRALARVFVQTNAENTRKASATLREAKSQARRLREALR